MDNLALALASSGNKLRSLKADVSEWHSSFRASRREEVVIARLRVGHTYLTHNYLLCGQVRPDCPMCAEPLTVQHVLLDCPGYRVARISCGLPASLAEVLGNDFQALQRVLRFLKVIRLFKNI